MIFHKKRILLLLYLSSMITLLAYPGNIYAQYENAWMNIGSLHNWYSEIGCEVEHGWVGRQQYGLRWPAIYNDKDSQAAKALWIGCTNYTDENGDNYPFKVVHVGPRFTGAFEFFPQQFEMVSRFNPPWLDVDGANTYREFVEVDRIDQAMKPDRMLISVTNSAIGVTMTRRIQQFSHPRHDNYIIVDFTFTNTGNTDNDADIEMPNQTLEGLYFFTQYRWAVNAETRYVIGNGTGWGMNTMLDARGDGVKQDPPDENFRAQFAWHGNFPPFSGGYDNIGGPIWDPGTSSGYVGAADSVGRLGAAHFIGVVTIHADKSASDPSDDVCQPPSTLYMGSDIPITAASNSQYDKVQMEEEYSWMALGHMSPRHADAVYPDGDYWKADAKEDPALSSPGGYTACDGYGPYTLGPGESVNIVIAEAAAGLSRELCIEYGKQYKDGVIDAAQKNLYVSQSRDSLFQTFRRAIANYQSGYEQAQPVLPPSAFYVSGGGDQISLSWDVSDPTGIDGFEIYRAIGEYDSSYHLIAEVGPEVRSYGDSDLERGPGYYYYISSIGEDATGKIRSSRYYTQTFDPTNLKRPAGTSMDDIRIVPNPYNISADPNNLLFPGERDKLAFFNIPGDCDIQIYTEIGERVTTIEHRDGTGDEYWSCTTDSKQIVVSGIYIAVIIDNKTGDRKIEKFVIIR